MKLARAQWDWARAVPFIVLTELAKPYVPTVDSIVEYQTGTLPEISPQILTTKQNRPTS